MSLETLPPELLHVLCDLCSDDDIYQLRLTSHYIKEVADEHMLGSLTVFFDMADLSMARGLIERNPRIAKTVIRLTLQTDHLPAAYTRQEWDVLRKQTMLAWAEKRHQLLPTDDPGLMHGPESELPGGEDRLAREKRIILLETTVFRQSQLRNAFKRYQELLADQKKVIDEQQLKLFIKDIFKRCPKLGSVKVDSRAGNVHPGLPWQISDSLRSGMVRPWGEPSNGVRPVTDTLLEAYEAGVELLQVIAGPVSPRFFKQDKSIMAKIYKATKDLTKISLRIESDFQDEKTVAIQQASGDNEVLPPSQQSEALTPELATTMMLEALGDGRVARFLTRAKKLIQLEVTGPLLAPTLPMIRLRDVVGTSPWVALRAIALTRVQCTQSELTAFLLKYSRTLQRLRLSDMRLTKGKWRSCFRQISGRFPELRFVGLTARFRDRHTAGTIWFEDHPAIMSQMEQFLITGEDEPDDFPYIS